jgi:hypothetical protein
MGAPVLLILIVTIGMLNVCLGFGLAMYLGYGPPGLNGIFQALGPMPTVVPDVSQPAAPGLGALYIPGTDEAVQQSATTPAAVGQTDGAGSHSEDDVLGDVQALTAAARSAMTTAVAPARQ